MQTLFRELVNDLDSDSTDYNFAYGIYAESLNISSFGNSSQIIDCINSNCRVGQNGLTNRMDLALFAVLEQLEERPEERKDSDTKKVIFFIF